LRLSVIIPVRNDPRIVGVAREIVRQLPPDAELIIADDGPPGTLPPIPGARIIAVGAGNQALARNRAAKAAGGGVLLFTDADVVIPPRWIEEVLGAFEDPSLLALQGGSTAVGGGWLARRIQAEYERFLDTHRAVDYADLCDSRCFAIRREVFLRFLFDDEDPWCADAALGRRLYEAGIFTKFSRSWQVGHKYPNSLAGELQRIQRQARAAAEHLARTGRNLFRGPREGRPRGLGGAVIRAAAGSRPRARAVSRLLFWSGVAAAAGGRFPGPLGGRLFSKGCRAAHLSGRLTPKLGGKPA
jgi:glycosyltransferase involved in cell wall biosynthesis